MHQKLTSGVVTSIFLMVVDRKTLFFFIVSVLVSDTGFYNRGKIYTIASKKRKLVGVMTGNEMGVVS